MFCTRNSRPVVTIQGLTHLTSIRRCDDISRCKISGIQVNGIKQRELRTVYFLRSVESMWDM